MKQSVIGRSGLNHRRTHCDAFLRCDEGRACELSRRVTAAVLFTRDGRPSMWLVLVGLVWATATATAFGTPG